MMDILTCIFMSVFMVADGFTMRGPSGPLVAPLGSSVVLPCYVDELLLTEGLEVEWRRTDSETLVHLYQDGESRAESQQQDYHDRAHFFTDQIQHGNFSLRLDNLRAEDEGEYTCRVYSQLESGEILVQIKHGFTVYGPAGPLVAPLGSSVVLPCYVDELIPTEGLEVEWRRTDSETLVHLYQDGESRAESQQQDYHDRAHFFTDQIQHGNFSLRLDNLTAEDEGRYTCRVYSQKDSGETVVQIKRERLIVSVSIHSISAYVGEDVTLNCSVDSHITPEHIEEVSWKKTYGCILVLLYQNNKTLPDSSDERYRDRVEFFTDEILKGNFSLRLKSVRTEDKGVYMCQVFAGGLSANATVVLEQLGFSSWHIAVLFFCIVAGPGAVLLLFSLIYCRSNNTVSTSNKIWNLQLSLVFCPNICMFFAFMLWGFTEGSLNETITCCALYILRLAMLIWAMDYLKYLQDNLKTWMKFFTVTTEHAVFTLVVYSVIYGWRMRAYDASILPGVVFGLCLAFAALPCAIFNVVDFERNCSQKHTRETSLFVQNHVIYGWRMRAHDASILTCGDSELLHATVVLLCPILNVVDLTWYILQMLDREVSFHIQNKVQLTWLTFSFGLPSLEIHIVGIVQSQLLICIPFIPCLQAKFKSLHHRWITLLWIITITLLDIILLIYVLLAILEREKEYLEWTCVILFIEVLRIMVFFKGNVQVLEDLVVQRRIQNTETSQQGEKALSRCNEIMYMFGAVGLILLSSVTLTAELILKARNGERVLKDLRVIVFSSECVFALYWLVLQMLAYWKIITTGFTHKGTQLKEGISENHEMNLSAPNPDVSQTQI
ncbi:uncharacterized protein LOC131537376 isoform X2 [Onychostoma macrolepis]|uniref:uncharacterized protein LOC131537376 isoform X2 n=1 Tax=Onychostoma macrolepis TaxID=369639 RepID=UPI00272BCFE7|nr:uncharacterized protein LOC131537376 isoform X2 [Onychostoma macrolepis]